MIDDFEVGNTIQKLQKDYDVAIIVQGKYYPDITSVIFKEFINRNPGVKLLIICSTYRSEIDLPTEEENKLIEKGQLLFLFVKEPSKEKYQSFWRTNNANQNLQRLTSFVGLKYAKDLGIKFALKIRSDTFLGEQNIVRTFISQLYKYPVFGKEIKARIIVSGQGTISNLEFWAPFHIRDHWYFGYTEDLLNFFDSTPKSNWKDGEGIETTCPESALTCVWLKDMRISVSNTKELLSRYFIVHNAVDVEQVRLSQTLYWKFNVKSYQLDGKNYLRSIYAEADCPGHTTTHQEWLDLYDSFIQIP